MIVNNKYKISWKHYDKNSKISPSNEELRCMIEKIIEDGADKHSVSSKIKVLFNSVDVYNRSFSECTIEEVEDTLAVKIIKGMSVVHPNDRFNRKKGVYESFKSAVSQFENKDIRTLLWKHFWKVREKKPPKLLLSRTMAFVDFLNQTATKRVEGNYEKYSLLSKTEIWFKRRDL